MKGITHGDIAFWDGEKYTPLAPGTAGQYLQTQGDNEDPQWATVSSSASTDMPTINAIDTSSLSGVQAAYNFEGDVNDDSGNGLNLDTGVSAVNYVWAYNKQWAYAPNSRSWRRSSNDTELAITGDLTIHCLFIPTRPITDTGDSIVEFSGSGETEATNYLYALYISGSTWLYFAETGAGTNIDHDFLVGSNQIPQLVTLVRSSNDVTLYVNGKASGTASSGESAPSGGTSAVLRLYANSSSQGMTCYYGGLVIQNTAMSAGDILDVAQQVGVAA